MNTIFNYIGRSTVAGGVAWLFGSSFVHVFALSLLILGSFEYILGGFEDGKVRE